MVNVFIGKLGHIFVILSFVSALAATYAYYRGSSSLSLDKQRQNLQTGKIVFILHTLFVIGVFLTLFFIIYNHYFEYHYAWSHSSRTLPVYYMISSFWEGQEGSFLLWMFWQALIGVLLIFTNKTWTGPVMTIFALVQAFLTSMILGVVIGELKIGSSPFVLLRDVMDAPIFQQNPDFIPEDGTGLNPLLQNYWMVIHPPTLFLGFATTLVPFSFAIAGLWKKRFKEWIRPALPWSSFSAAVLGLGIIMGAYWAYETLNFGGYWNWDPVENAVYIPWLILIAAIHTMINYRKSGSGLKSSMILIVSTFILILYSTFLTRSGILGESSVHSFTDLGLSGQLLLYLLAFTILAIALLIYRWKEIPTTEKEISTYSSEFWIFIGAITLCLMGFQVLIPTSIPVFNAIIEALGFESNMAPPAEQVEFYTKFQIWFAIAVAILSGTGQFFWWKRLDREKLMNEITIPVVVTLVISGLIIIIGQINTFSFILLITAGTYTVVANGKILFNFIVKNVQLSGGSVAHIGIGMMLIGILFSSGFSTVISQNQTGRIYSQDLPEDINRDNVLLWVNEARDMKGFKITYKGQRIEARNVPGFINKELVVPTMKPHEVVAIDTIAKGERIYFTRGDTLEIYPENTYYEIHYQNGEKEFTLFPRAQVNPNMGLIASPDIKRTFSKDLYTHVSSIPDPEHELEWSELAEHEIKIGERFFVNDFVAVLEKVERVSEVQDLELTEQDVAVKASIRLYGNDQNYVANPIYLIKDRMLGRIPDFVSDLGIKLTFMNVHPDSDSFTIGVNTTQRDYVIMKAMEKPMINILWTGTILLMLGFGMSTYRRYHEFSRMREKGRE